VQMRPGIFLSQRRARTPPQMTDRKKGCGDHDVFLVDRYIRRQGHRKGKNNRKQEKRKK
jgi:hypothetical protein